MIRTVDPRGLINYLKPADIYQPSSLSSQPGVIQRLIEHEKKLVNTQVPVVSDQDAVKLNLSPRKYVQPSDLQLPQSIHGKYANGALVTENGTRGSYRNLGDQTYGFEFGSFKNGIYLTSNQAFALDSKTGEIVNFSVKRNATEFSLTKFQSIQVPKEHEDKPFLNGTKDKNKITFNNFEMTLDGKGGFSAVLKGAEGKDIYGHGLMDKTGNMIIGFENGLAYKAHYETDGKEFSVYTPQMITAV